MNKILPFILLFLISFVSHAQFDVVNLADRSVISDGQTFNFTEASCGYTDNCNFKFEVTNTSAQDIYIQIIVDDMVNNNGSNFQVCFASVCLNSITLNGAYPAPAALIPAGTSNSAGNNFWNLYPAGTTTPMSWTFRFQAFDAAGNEIGTSKSMTYAYRPTLNVSDTEILNLDIESTVINENLHVSVDEDITGIIYDMTGRQVKNIEVPSGSQIIDLSALTSQMYLVRFTNDKGASSTTKIIKK